MGEEILNLATDFVIATIGIQIGHVAPEEITMKARMELDDKGVRVLAVDFIVPIFPRYFFQQKLTKKVKFLKLNVVLLSFSTEEVILFRIFLQKVGG